MITPLFEGETNLAVSNEVSLQNLGLGRDEASIQVNITDTATVVVRGRLSQNSGWSVIKTITTSDLQPIYRVPYIQLEITSNTGSVSAFIAS